MQDVNVKIQSGLQVINYRRHKMKILLALIMILAGLALAVYVGVWLLFIKGIIQIVEEFKSPEAMDSAVIAWGILKILCASIVGSLCAIIGIVPGMAILKS